MDTDNNKYGGYQKEGGRVGSKEERVKCKVTEDDLTLDGGYKMQYQDHVS